MEKLFHKYSHWLRHHVHKLKRSVSHHEIFHSKNARLAIMLVIAAAIPLTVFAAQQVQNLQQEAASTRPACDGNTLLHVTNDTNFSNGPFTDGEGLIFSHTDGPITKGMFEEEDFTGGGATGCTHDEANGWIRCKAKYSDNKKKDLDDATWTFRTVECNYQIKKPVEPTKKPKDPNKPTVKPSDTSPSPTPPTGTPTENPGIDTLQFTPDSSPITLDLPSDPNATIMRTTVVRINVIKTGKTYDLNDTKISVTGLPANQYRVDDNLDWIESIQGKLSTGTYDFTVTVKDNAGQVIGTRTGQLLVTRNGAQNPTPTQKTATPTPTKVPFVPPTSKPATPIPTKQPGVPGAGVITPTTFEGQNCPGGVCP